MAERIRDLLEEAVARVEPRTVDPAAAVVRLRRTRQRRAFLATAFASLGVLATGGLIVPQIRTDSPPPVAVPDRPLPVAHFADGVAVSGGLRLPVPAGWQAVTGGRDGSCADPDRTVFIAGATDAACPLAAITVAVSDQEMTAPAGGVLTADGLVRTPPISVTLAGGEPAWASNRIDEADAAQGAYALELVLPWSRTFVRLRTSLAETRGILDSIRTEPVDGGRLIVPDVPAVAELITPDPDDHTYPQRAKATDTPTLLEAVRLLREQTETVADKEACAGPGQEGLRLDIGTAHVVVALGGDCQEAVSSLGGRVRFDADAVRELKHLFGIVR